MKICLSVFAIFFLLTYNDLCAGAPPSVAEHTILVDSSGSMDGFYNAGSLRALVLDLQRILGGAKLYLFSDTGPKIVDSADDLHYIRGDTRIDLGFLGVLEGKRPDIVWLITDNVQDRSETPYVDASTREFYKLLRRSDVVGIVVLPCFLPFDGKVYINREGRQYSQAYKGKKGLLVYGILLDNAYKDQFADISSRIEKSLANYRPKLLLAKPLDSATFDIKVAEDRRSNVSLNERGIFFGRGFKEGRKVPVVFYVKLISKFEDLIVSGNLKVGVVDNRLRGQGFEDTSVDCRIDPEKVSLQPGKTSETVYRVTLNISRVRMRRDPMSILRATFSGKPGRMEGKVRLEVRVPREGFRLTNDLLKNYNTDDIGDYERIYGLGSLINYMSADITTIPIEHDIVLLVNYPYWPTILVILLAVVFFGDILFAYRIYSSLKSERFAISIDGQEERVFPLIPLTGRYRISVGGKTCAVISKGTGGSIIVKAKPGFTIDGTSKKRRLNRGYDSFLITDDGETNINVWIRSLKGEDLVKGKGSDLDVGF